MFHWELAMVLTGNTVTKYRAFVTGNGPLENSEERLSRDKVARALEQGEQ